MKKVYLVVKDRTTITNIMGDTTVLVESNGDFEVAETVTNHEPRKRSVVLADTGKGTLKKSPQGQNRTLTITLPCKEASEEEFLLQAQKVFLTMKVNGNA